MKFISYLLIFIMSTGCTSLQPIETSSGQLQDQTYLETVIKNGDTIHVTMKNGVSHEFTVTELTDQFINGGDINIPLSDISSIKVKKVSIGKTAAVVGAIILLIGLKNAEIFGKSIL